MAAEFAGVVVVGVGINALYDACKALYRRIQARSRASTALQALHRAIQNAHDNIMRSELALAETESGQFCLAKFQALLTEVSVMLRKLSTARGKSKYVCSKETRAYCENLKERCELLTQSSRGLRDLWDTQHPGRADEFLAPPEVAAAGGAAAGAAAPTRAADGTADTTPTSLPAVAPPPGAWAVGSSDSETVPPRTSAAAAADGERSPAAPTRVLSYGELERILSDVLAESPRVWGSEAEGGSAAVASVAVEEFISELQTQPDGDSATVEDLLRSCQKLQDLTAPLAGSIKFVTAAEGGDDWDFYYESNDSEVGEAGEVAGSL